MIRLGKGEKIVESIEGFCRENGIESGYFMGIGGLEKAEIAYYDLGNRKYYSKIFDEPPMELLTLNGNVTLTEGKLKVHAHVVIGTSKFSTFGGHLNEGVVSPTCEIVFVPFGEKIERKPDDETGLSLLDV